MPSTHLPKGLTFLDADVVIAPLDVQLGEVLQVAGPIEQVERMVEWFVPRSQCA